MHTHILVLLYESFDQISFILDFGTTSVTSNKTFYRKPNSPPVVYTRHTAEDLRIEWCVTFSSLHFNSLCPIDNL